MNIHFQKLTYRLQRAKGKAMRMQNADGQAVYYNVVEKHKKIRYQIQAASGLTITRGDKKLVKSRTFAQEHQAEAWLRRNGYKTV